MNLKKNKLKHNSFNSTTPANFRTVLKSRANKQTLQHINNLSTTFQQSFIQDDNISVKSSKSVLKKNNLNNQGTDKLKNFVRNMKQSSKFDQQLNNYKLPHSQQCRNLKSSRSSIYSVTSNRSKANILTSIHKSKNIQDNKSVISTLSMLESQLLDSFDNQNKNQFYGSKQKINEKLNQMAEKVDRLLKSKLKSLMIKARSKYRYNPKPFMGSGSQINQSIEENADCSIIKKQIQNIIKTINLLKQKDSDQNFSISQVEEQILKLDKKIRMFQKLLASNYTESQILKKFYFAQKSQKYPHLNKKQKILQQISKRKQLLRCNSNLQNRSLVVNKPIIKYESTSKYFYTKPSRSAYLNECYKQKSFVANCQPLTRSSYGREFLNYGTLPVFNYKPHDTKNLSSKMNTHKSNYQQSFKAKNISMKQINYKQLDCFKNKLKTGNISFAQMYKNKEIGKKQVSVDKIVRNIRSQSMQKQNKCSVQKALQALSLLQKQKEKSLYQSDWKFMGDTQMKREFIWHNKMTTQQKQSLKGDSNIPQGRITSKNENLNSLKASFKMSFLR